MKILSLLLIIILLGVWNPAFAANTHAIDVELDSSQYLTAADSTDLSITGDLTVQGWFKPESQPNVDGTPYTLFSKWVSTSQRSFLTYYYTPDAGVTYKLEFGNSSDCEAGTTLTADSVGQTLTNGTWYHLAFVYTASAGQVEFFVNGSSIGTAAGLNTSICDGTAAFAIGALANPLFYADGRFDDVRLYAVARTGAQISADYQQELNGNETNLKAYYMLNGTSLEDKGTVTDPAGAVADDLTNNNSATFVADPAFTEAVVSNPRSNTIFNPMNFNGGVIIK